MDSTYQKTKDILESSGIRVTSQRLEMAHLLFSKNQHFSAEEVYQLINSHFPHMSRATVFNNLKLFSEKEIIGKLEIKNGVTYFDSNNKKHHHALDENSGEIFDIDLDVELEEKIHQQLKEHLELKLGKKWNNSKLQITLRGFE